MVHRIGARNVNDAYHEARFFLSTCDSTDSRYGVTRRAPGTVITHYRTPEECVLFERGRRANPFFHLFESLWLLAGRDDVAFVQHFASRMREFSDNGLTFHGAYGVRLGLNMGDNSWVGAIIEELRAKPDSRRAVAVLWDNERDWTAIRSGTARDIPCNDLIKVDIRDGAVNLMVIARSNDAIWGAYGSNVVMFSMLLRYIAASLGLPVGWYQQISLDFHEYVEVADRTPMPAGVGSLYQHPGDPYTEGLVRVVPFGDINTWTQDLDHFFLRVDQRLDPTVGLVNPWWQEVAVPMWQAWTALRGGIGSQVISASGREDARQVIGEAILDGARPTVDWLFAARQWLER